MIELPDQINAILLQKFGWSCEDIAALKEKYDNSINKIKFLETVNVITDYKLSYQDIESFDLENDKDAIYHKAIESKVLISTSEKTEDFVINEVKDWNKHKDKEIQQVIDNYKKIKKNYENSSIKKNTTKETFKALPTDFFTSCSDDEAYNYIFKAIELTKEYEPRSIQLIASLLLIEKNTKMNRILQILTGEGKTIIISIIAAFLVHKKSKVDIITSSEVLANQSYNETVEFFELLKITVGSNCDQKADIRTRKPKKEIYTYDVVYGTSHSFEADILSDEYEKTGIRNGREFDSVIVDEIDNMFIDNHSGQTLLSSKTPFFERLNFIFYYIWNMIKDWTDVSKITDHTKKTLEEMLLSLINNSDGDKESLSENYLPAYLKTLVKKEAKLWIDNAIKSKFYLKEGVDYVLNKTKSNILPVDSSNTGVVQTNSHYSDGIHQFLLIKHDLEMIPFSLTTNFSSNVGLFKRYGKQNKIYGLTGTIGTTNSQELLNKIYNIDFIKIPPFKQRILYELSHRICEEATFVLNIGEVIKRETQNDRPILIICPDIQTGENVYNYLSKFIITEENKLVKYFRNDIDQIELDKEDVTFGKVYVSTNLSGRGTDLKIKEELEKKGGLHVCITFMPKNQRVLEQAFGRSGRKGQPGTWQMILTTNEFHSDESTITSLRNNINKINEYLHNTPNATVDFNDIVLTIDQLYQSRDKREEEENKNILKNVDDITNQDELFEKFCKFLKDTPEVGEGNCPIRKNIEERWAIWLLTNKEIKNKDELFKKFDSFIEEIKEDIKNGRVEQNPTYLNKLANEEICLNLYDEDNQRSCIGIIYDWLFEKKKEPNFPYVKKILTKSIERFNCSFIPYYLRGICSACQQYKNDAINDLKKASELIIEEAFSSNFINIAVMQDKTQSNKFALYQNINDQIIEQNIKQLQELDSDKILVEKLKITHLFLEPSIQNDLKELETNGLEYVFIIKKKKTFLDNLGFFLLGGLQIVGSFFVGGPLSPIGAMLFSSGVNDIITSISDSLRGASPSWGDYFQAKASEYLNKAANILTSSSVVSRLHQMNLSDLSVSEIFKKIGRNDSRLSQDMFKGKDLGVNLEGTVDNVLNRLGAANQKINDVIKDGGVKKIYVMTMLDAFTPRNEYHQRELKSINVDNEKIRFKFNKKCKEQQLKLRKEGLDIEQKKREKQYKEQVEKQQKQLDELKKQKKELIGKGKKLLEDKQKKQPKVNNIRAVLNLDNKDTKTVKDFKKQNKNISKSEIPQITKSEPFKSTPIEGTNQEDVENCYLKNLDEYNKYLTDLNSSELKSSELFAVSAWGDKIQSIYNEKLNTYNEENKAAVDQYNQRVSEHKKQWDDFQNFINTKKQELTVQETNINNKVEQQQKFAESLSFITKNKKYLELLKEVVNNQYKNKYDQITTEILDFLKTKCNPTQIDHQLVNELDNCLTQKKKEYESLHQEIAKLKTEFQSSLEQFKQKAEEKELSLKNEAQSLQKERQDLTTTQEQNRDVGEFDVQLISQNMINGVPMSFENPLQNEVYQSAVDLLANANDQNNERVATRLYQITEENCSKPVQLSNDNHTNLTSSFLTEKNNSDYKFNHNDIINIAESIISNYDDKDNNDKYSFVFKDTQLDPNAKIVVGMFDGGNNSNEKIIVFLINKSNKHLYCVNYNQEQDFKSFIDNLNLGELKWILNNEKGEPVKQNDIGVVALFQMKKIIKEFENLEQEKFADEFPKMKFSIAKTSKLFKLRQDKFPMLYLRKFITEMEKEGVVDYNNENDNPYGILITRMSNTEKENKDIENLIGTHLKDAVIRDKKKDKKKYNQWDDWKVQYRNKLPT